MIELLKEIHRIELEFYEKYLANSLTPEQAQQYLFEIRALRQQFFILGR